jgi:hypothetical protein
MGLVAHLYRDSRWAERHPVELDATLRDPDWSPVDVMVEDLSESGFRVTTANDMPVGAEIGLGLAGIGMRQARVVRRAESLYGCEFLAPLSHAELRAALAGPPTQPIALPLDPRPVGEEEAHHERLPMPMRVLAIAACAVAAWAILIALGWAVADMTLSLVQG